MCTYGKRFWRQVYFSGEIVETGLLLRGAMTYQANSVDNVVVEEEEDIVQRQRAHQVQEEPGPEQHVATSRFTNILRTKCVNKMVNL